MTDLTSKRWIVAKGVMFLGIAVTAAALILLDTPSLRIAVLLGLLTWASCRPYGAGIQETVDLPGPRLPPG
jgi:hypothetical protein